MLLGVGWLRLAMGRGLISWNVVRRGIVQLGE
jgi:hypothetical protein